MSKTFVKLAGEEFEVEIIAHSITYTGSTTEISPEIQFKREDQVRLSYAIAKWQEEGSDITFRSEE